MVCIDQLSVSVDTKEIIHNCSLTLPEGLTQVIMGPNGSGKSSLAHTIAGHPSYEVTQGSLVLNQEDMTTWPPHKRAQSGIFLSFQHPVALPGVSVERFLHEIYRTLVTKEISFDALQAQIRAGMEQLELSPSFLYRSLHDGFSGGEKKKFEMLQILLFRPRYLILDEIDSGLDIDALAVIARALNWLRQESPAMSMLLITHYQRILDYLSIDTAHIMLDGTIIASGNQQLIAQVDQGGFTQFKQMQA